MTSRHYKIWTPIRVAMVAGGLFIAGYAALSLYTTFAVAPPGFKTLFILMVIGGLLITLHAWRSEIITSPEGVIYQSVFYRIDTPWSNIERIAKNNRRRDVLYLREGAIQAAAPLSLLLKGSGRDRTITLSLHIPAWRFSPFKEDVKRYAPHLLAADEPQPDHEDELYV